MHFHLRQQHPCPALGPDLDVGAGVLGDQPFACLFRIDTQRFGLVADILGFLDGRDQFDRATWRSAEPTTLSFLRQCEVLGLLS